MVEFTEERRVMTKTEKAILFAVNAHAGLKRKGKNRPYILHPIEVMTIVGSITEDEDILAAAVLHDTIEDTSVTAADIEREFGSSVAKLVSEESEDKRAELPAEATWKIRKQETINHLKTANRNTKLICLGDKLANIREMSLDYAKLQDQLWERFNQKDKALHAWYYRSICDVLEEEFGSIPAIREYRSLLKTVFGVGGELADTEV